MYGDPIRILLIERDPEDAELIHKSLLESPGNFVVKHRQEFQDEEAKDLAESTDLILLGLSPRSGLQELNRIRQEYPYLPVVVLTTLDDTLFALKAVRSGAQEYLLKNQTSGTLLLRTIRYSIERNRVEGELRYRLEFEKLIATISTHFINISLDQIDRGLDRALQAIGEFTEADRCYLFLFSNDSKTLSNSHEWCGEGIESQIHRRQNLPVSTFSWAVEQLKRAETVYAEDIQELPPEADAEKHEFGLADVQSTVCVPLLYGGEAVGFLGFDSVRKRRSWSQDTLSLLKIAGDMLVNALERKDTQEKLKRREERLRLFTRATNDVIWDWEIATGKIWWNENLQRVFGFNPDSPANNYEWWLDRIHPEERQLVLSRIERVIREGGTFLATEYRFQCADGSYAHVMNRGYVVFDHDSKPVRMIGAMMDLTERKRMEEALRTSLPGTVSESTRSSTLSD